MAGQEEISVHLDEAVIDVNSLVHPTIDAHNVVQLRRWLQCHGHRQSGNKAQLVERLE